MATKNKDININKVKTNIKNKKTKMPEMDNEMDNDLIYTTMYATIYGESLKAHENIQKNYPNIKTDMKKLKILKNMKKENPDMSEKEMIAHAYTIALMTHITSL